MQTLQSGSPGASGWAASRPGVTLGAGVAGAAVGIAVASRLTAGAGVARTSPASGAGGTDIAGGAGGHAVAAWKAVGLRDAELPLRAAPLGTAGADRNIARCAGRIGGVFETVTVVVAAVRAAAVPYVRRRPRVGTWCPRRRSSSAIQVQTAVAVVSGCSRAVVGHAPDLVAEPLRTLTT